MVFGGAILIIIHCFYLHFSFSSAILVLYFYGLRYFFKERISRSSSPLLHGTMSNSVVSLFEGLSTSESSRPRRMMLLVNPQSGKGQALTLYNNQIQRMLNEAGVQHTLVITGGFMVLTSPDGALKL